ncbi:MAG: LPS export ABC transporter permease LptF [Woeseiaceae bacterium]|nr:LPS export ABC transporter permease LptF [Woeseiaceae bacterium]
MFRILDRYIFREVASTWLAVTGVLLLILLTNQFARVLGDVAKGKLPKNAALEVIGLSAVQYLNILVPIGLFLAVMLAMGRLYRDSEMPAMMACRVGLAGVYRPIAMLLVPLTLLVAWVAIEVGPKSMLSVDMIGAEAKREADLASIEPGRFTMFGPDNAVVYGESVDENGVMSGVFIQRRTTESAIEVVVADRGEQVASEDPNTRLLVLTNGRRYEGVPGTAQFRVVEFAEHGIPYRLPSLEAPDPRPRAMSVQQLAASSDPEHLAELHWRLGIPISTILLGILAVPLSRSQPRAGRYGRLAIGLLVFIIYFNMLNAAKAWIEQGTVDPMVGLWWVHASVLAIALGMLSFQNGWHRRLFQ